MSHGVSIIYDTQQVDYRKVSSEKNIVSILYCSNKKKKIKSLKVATSIYFFLNKYSNFFT